MQKTPRSFICNPFRNWEFRFFRITAQEILFLIWARPNLHCSSFRRHLNEFITHFWPIGSDFWPLFAPEFRVLSQNSFQFWNKQSKFQKNHKLSDFLHFFFLFCLLKSSNSLQFCQNIRKILCSIDFVKY